MSAGVVAQTADNAPNVGPVAASAKPTTSKANRKKDLIESTLAFAAQNIDLTRPKVAASQAQSHDSELFWTTIDRNGRKKRIASVPDQEPATAIETEKESSREERTNEKSTAGDTQRLDVTLQRTEAPTVLDSQPLPVPNDVGTDSSGKKEPQTKSKKKTNKHKRQQQLRKSVGNFNKQPLEGFQLIEPEFTSSGAGHRRGRSSDKAGRVEPAAQKALSAVVESVQDSSKKETSVTSSRKHKPKKNRKLKPTEEQDETVIEKTNEVENDIKQVVQTGTVLENGDLEQVGRKQDSMELVSTPTDQESSMEEKPVFAHNEMEVNEILPPVIEEKQIANVQLSVDTHAFVAAAKQLAISPISLNSPTLPALEEDEAEDHVDGADDGIGSEGDDMRTKRGSMSGAGYTESIDSGLQSPAPCGGVASPETSSMVSSIESQPANDLPGVNSTQSALSQVVGTWLMSKLQVHEPEEVFILPSNPLLIQRLERFHQLQRRERRERLRGAVSSESEGEDEEYDLEDENDEDADSDYMSDGQGRIDRTQSDDATSSNPGSPLNSTQQQGAGLVQKTHLEDAPTGSQLANESQRPAVQHSDSGNIGASVHRAADSKRCVIM
uniref:Uncharacterized protein n=1 Tax=Anopheles stephensi TaxID=30069 RepID=A0A182Y1Y3_ANOST